MFNIIQIKHCAYVTSTTMLRFHVCAIAIGVWMHSLLDAGSIMRHEPCLHTCNNSIWDDHFLNEYHLRGQYPVWDFKKKRNNHMYSLFCQVDCGATLLWLARWPALHKRPGLFFSTNSFLQFILCFLISDCINCLDMRYKQHLHFTTAITFLTDCWTLCGGR